MESEQMNDVDMLNIHPEEDDGQMETELLNGSGDEVRVKFILFWLAEKF